MSGTDGARELRAKTASPGGWGWSANAETDPRYIQLMPGQYRNRRRCDCGCGGKCSHAGMANGLAMTRGCEWSMRRWVRDPNAGTREHWERHDAKQMAKPNGAVWCAAGNCPTPPVRRPAGWTLASVRKALRENAGWTCDKSGDFCPDHPPARAARGTGTTTDTEERTDG